MSPLPADVPPPPRLGPTLLRGAAAGAALGLGFFLAEGALLWSQDAVGLRMEQRGPFAALFAAVRPMLPPLLGKVLAVYLVGVGALGALAAVLASTWPVRGRAARAGAWAVHVAWLLGALVWSHAVERPALFDDLPFGQAALDQATRSGAPWQGLALAWAWTAAHLALWARARLIRGDRWRPALAVAAGAAVAAGLMGAGPRAAPGDAPLVLLIGVDAFRPDRLVALGSPREVAPNLERFAREAVIFTNAWTPIAQTEPAWRSLLTARWPPAAGSRYPLTAPERWPERPTFPAALASAGWNTVFATDCSRFHFEGPESGFAERLQPPRGAINFALEKLRFRGVGVLADNGLGARWLPEAVDNRALAGIHDPAGYAARLARRLVEEAGKGPTLFAWHSTAAHFPGDPSYPHYRRYVDASRPLQRRLRMVFAPIAEGRAPPAAGEWGQADSEALYDELLGQSDAQVGELFEALRRAGAWDRAWIVVFSDHGESFHADQPGLAGATPVHGARLGAEENRILLLVKPPGPAKPARTDALVRLLDLGPTLLDAAGLGPLPQADGRSLLPLLRGEPEPPRLLYAETGYTHASPSAFDPAHRASAPRSFDAYAIAPDGTISLGDAAHAGVLAEKDVGAFDGQHWLVRAPLADGAVRERCDGNCDALRSFLERVENAP